MKLEFDGNGIPVVIGFPGDHELLFIGQYVGQTDKRFPADGFVAVIAQKAAIKRGDQELFENASVAFCGISGGEMTMYKAWHCHKYSQGGMLEFLKPQSSQEDEPIIFWYPPGHKHRSSLHLNASRGYFQKEWFLK